MTMTTTTIPATISGPARMLGNFATMLASDIDPDKFADRCGTTINHPAFVLGHCAYYLGVSVTMLGGSIEFDPDEEQLFKNGAECLDDPSVYPSKEESIARFVERCNFVAGFLDTCDDSAFARPNEEGPFVGEFTTMGQVVAFMILGHTSFHLGQISGWRRAAGMGPAMPA